LARPFASERFAPRFAATTRSLRALQQERHCTKDFGFGFLNNNHKLKKDRTSW
jgi:hypothetical protein